MRQNARGGPRSRLAAIAGLMVTGCVLQEDAWRLDYDEAYCELNNACLVDAGRSPLDCVRAAQDTDVIVSVGCAFNPSAARTCLDALEVAGCDPATGTVVVPEDCERVCEAS